MLDVKITKFEEELYRKDPRSPAYLDSMLGRFNRVVQISGLFRELKAHESFEKPSDIRRRKRREAILKQRRKESKNAIRKTRTPHPGGTRDTGARI